MGLSLRSLGDKTGFSASFLSQVELEQVSPSLSSLGRIAEALGVTLSELLSEPAATSGPVVHRRRQHQGLRSEWSRATIQSLLPPGVDERVEVMLVVLEPDGRSGKTPLGRTGNELAFCVRGKITLMLDGERHELGAGDSIFYDASRDRQWENPGKRNAEIILINFRTQ